MQVIIPHKKKKTFFVVLKQRCMGFRDFSKINRGSAHTSPISLLEMLCCSDVMEEVSDQMKLLNAFPLLMVMDVTGEKTTASVRLIEAMTVKQILKKMEKFDETTMGYYLKNPFMKIEASIKCNFPRDNCR